MLKSVTTVRPVLAFLQIKNLLCRWLVLFKTMFTELMLRCHKIELVMIRLLLVFKRY